MDEYDFMSGEEWSEETAEEIESEEQTIEERIDGWRELNDLRWFSEIPVVPQPITVNSNRLNHETKTTLLQQWKASAAAAVKKRPRLNLEGKTLREGSSAVGVRSFQDFRQGRRTPSQPIRNPERPDLNLLSQEFTPVPTNRKKKRCGRGECGERSRYDAASMVAANRVGAWEAEAQGVEGEIRESEEKNKCAWRIRCSYLQRSKEYKITVAELNHSCPGTIHGWRGPLGRAT
ncbi:hypothetical protein R1sor_015509 [Riccia sorocarpa]|uniref:Uncharacterized protein n=1 Tax=Riccia sorocarpa TaxID=122646 RepID=A0ABD3HFS3_9MARC